MLAMNLQYRWLLLIFWIVATTARAAEEETNLLKSLAK
jgi:hypothetical protein